MYSHIYKYILSPLRSWQLFPMSVASSVLTLVLVAAFHPSYCIYSYISIYVYTYIFIFVYLHIYKCFPTSLRLWQLFPMAVASSEQTLVLVAAFHLSYCIYTYIHIYIYIYICIFTYL